MSFQTKSEIRNPKSENAVLRLRPGFAAALLTEKHPPTSAVTLWKNLGNVK
jgi:hypothetical protein